MHVLVSKYADHLPLYRQAQIYARQGVTLDRSTLADWVGRAAWWLTPLRDHLLANLRRSPRLFADETTAPVLDLGRGRTKTGQLWAYTRDDRPRGYNALGRSNRVQLAYCWAHVRRGFFDIAASRPLATEALVRIARLYAIEQGIRGRSPDERRAARRN